MTNVVTGGEPKANTWHPPVWICYERGSRHPLTTAVHKWSYMYLSKETLSLWPRQAYGPGCSCPPSPTSLSHDTTGLRTVWHLQKTVRSSAKMLGGAGHHEYRARSFWCLECCGGRGERNHSEFGDVGSRIGKRDRDVGSRGQDPSRGQGGVELGSCRRAE